MFQRLKKIFSITFILLFFSSFVSAKNVSVSASIDPSTIGLDETATLTVEIVGGKSSDPALPQVLGLEFDLTGQSSNFQMINGDVTTSKIFYYSVFANRAGEYKIPPISVFSDAIEYKSQALQLSVLDKSTAQKFNQHKGFIPPQSQSEPLKNSNENLDSKFWLESSIDKNSVWFGEQILYKVKLFSFSGLRSVEFTMPEFDGFRVENVLENKQSQEIVNGRNCLVVENIFALFPVKNGNLNIPAARVKVSYDVHQAPSKNQSVDPFFGNIFNSFGMTKTISKELASNEKNLTVKPLPEPVPNNFTGLVGEFGVQTLLSSEPKKIGDSLDLTIQVSGAGYVRDAEIPAFDLDSFKVYADKPEVEINKSSLGISGRKSFKYALVVSGGGNLQIPVIELSYFDPKKQTYETLQTQSYDFLIPQELLSEPVSQKPVLPESKKANQQDHLIKQNNLITNDINNFYTKVRPYIKTFLLPSLLILMGAFCFGFCFYLLQKRLRLRSNSTQAQIKKLKSFLKKKNIKMESLYKELKSCTAQLNQGHFDSMTSFEILTELFGHLSIDKQKEIKDVLLKIELLNYQKRFDEKLTEDELNVLRRGLDSL